MERICKFDVLINNPASAVSTREGGKSNPKVPFNVSLELAVPHGEELFVGVSTPAGADIFLVDEVDCIELLFAMTIFVRRRDDFSVLYLPDLQAWRGEAERGCSRKNNKRELVSC